MGRRQSEDAATVSRCLLGLVEGVGLGAEVRGRRRRVHKVAAEHGLHERAEDQVGAAAK